MYMKMRLFLLSLLMCLSLSFNGAVAQDKPAVPDTSVVDTANATVVDEELLGDAGDAETDSLLVAATEGGMYAQLKTKFVEGGVGFMSLVALTLVIGLTICIERIIYLTLSEIDAKKFMASLEKKLMGEGVEEAKTLCRDTRGPVASICYQGLLRIKDKRDNIERSISSYGSVQASNMEKGCTWITLLIAMAPSLGFLGTVIGMVISFDSIQQAGDIGPKIVAEGMKVALITTIFGIITALILQLFYNYVLSKIDHLTAQMEESAITLLEIIDSYNEAKK